MKSKVTIKESIENEKMPYRKYESYWRKFLCLNHIRFVCSWIILYDIIPPAAYVLACGNYII